MSIHLCPMPRLLGNRRDGDEKENENKVGFHSGHRVINANPIILYSRRAPTFASHSLSPGDTSQRSRPTMCLPARRRARNRPMASFHDRPPGTGVPVDGQSVGSSPSMNEAIGLRSEEHTSELQSPD